MTGDAAGEPGLYFLFTNAAHWIFCPGATRRMNSKSDLVTLYADAFALSLTAHAVIAVRLTKMAFGAVDPNRESSLMVSEKYDAAAEATLTAAHSIASGEGHYAAARAMAVYRRRVERNIQRLTGG